MRRRCTTCANLLLCLQQLVNLCVFCRLADAHLVYMLSLLQQDAALFLYELYEMLVDHFGADAVRLCAS